MKQLKYILPLLLTIITLSIYNFIETQATTNQYQLTFQENKFVDNSITQIINNNDWNITTPTEIINNTLILNNTQYVSLIRFYDINGNFVDGISLTTSNELTVSIPTNSYYFTLVSREPFTSSYNSNISYSNFQTVVAFHSTPAPAYTLDYLDDGLPYISDIRISNDLNDTLFEAHHLIEIDSSTVYDPFTTLELVTWNERDPNEVLLSDWVPLETVTITYIKTNTSNGIHTNYFYLNSLNFATASNGQLVFKLDNDTVTTLATIEHSSEETTNQNDFPNGLDYEIPLDVTFYEYRVIPGQPPFNVQLGPQSTQNIYPFEFIEFPTLQSIEGYTFDRWQITNATNLDAINPNESLIYDYTTITSGNLTLLHSIDVDPSLPILLIPLYTELSQYVVTFLDYDNTFISSGLVTQGESAPLPTEPTRVGHTFAYWEPPVADVQGNITTVAQYTTNTYQVTWRNTDFSTLKIETVAYSGLATAPTIQGFTQLQWSPDPTQPITENTTIVLVGSTPISSLPSPTSLTDLFTAVLGSSVGAILTLGTIDLFGIQLSSLIYLFIFGSLALTFLKIIRGN